MKTKEPLNKNLIYVKFEYEEAVEAKRELLQAEISLLKMAQKMKIYQILRKKELNIKIKLKRSLGGAKTNLNNLQKILPRIQTIDIQTHVIKNPLKTPNKKNIEYDSSLKKELNEIQEKLRALQ